MFEMNIFDNTSTLQILLVQAGSTDLDKQGRITGALDIPLSEEGVREANDAADDLMRYDIDVIYSASCLAAKQTAERLSQKNNIKVRVEESWTNLDHGLWHGKSIEELKEMQPKLYRQWSESPESVCPPGWRDVRGSPQSTQVVAEENSQKTPIWCGRFGCPGTSLQHHAFRGRIVCQR